MIVVDSSVMVRLVVGGRDGGEAARLFRQDPEWVGPTSLMSGVRCVLIGLVRGRSLTVDQAKAMCDDAALALGGRIVTVPSARVIEAEQAEFVVVARELGVPLATGDRAVLSAARDVAIWVGTG